jgi:hypothetical protein
MYVMAGAWGAPEVGVALLSVALVCGQTAGSLAADGFGLSPAGRQPVTAGRVAGVALTIAAVVASALGARAHLHFAVLAFTVVAASPPPCSRRPTAISPASPASRSSPGP